MLEMTKLWGLACAFKDGAVPASELTEGQNERKVVHLPNLFEFASFVHFPMGCIIGPYLEYSDFINWVQFTGPYKELPRGGFESVVPAIIRYLSGLGCLAVHLFIVVGLESPTSATQTPEFKDWKTIWHRMAYYSLCMAGLRLMYYSGWCINDGALIGCGLAYSGKKDGKHTWDRMYNIDIIALEFKSVSCV